MQTIVSKNDLIRVLDLIPAWVHDSSTDWAAVSHALLDAISNDVADAMLNIARSDLSRRTFPLSTRVEIKRRHRRRRRRYTCHIRVLLRNKPYESTLRHPRLAFLERSPAFRFWMKIAPPVPPPPTVSDTAFATLSRGQDLLSRGGNDASNNTACPICLESLHHAADSACTSTEGPAGGAHVASSDAAMADIPVEMPCRHCFHESCLRKWLNRNSRCPVCRYDMLHPDGRDDMDAGDFTSVSATTTIHEEEADVADTTEESAEWAEVPPPPHAPEEDYHHPGRQSLEEGTEMDEFVDSIVQHMSCKRPARMYIHNTYGRLHGCRTKHTSFAYGDAISGSPRSEHRMVSPVRSHVGY